MKDKKQRIIIIVLIVISIIRFLISFNMPSFYLGNLKYDDALMNEDEYKFVMLILML